MVESVLESHHSFPVFEVADGKRKGLLERLLSLFADVRAGEGAGVLLLAANAFVLLASYYLLKPIREALILTEWSPEGKAYTAAGQAVLLVLIVPAYSAFAARVVRVRLIAWVTLFFATHTVIFAALGPWFRVGVAFYLWLGILNYLLVGQFWAFANDLYDEHKGKRLFPLVGVGAALGGLAGAQLAGALFPKLGPYTLMLLGGGVLAASVLFTLVVNNRESRGAGTRQRRIAREPIGGKGAFHLIAGSRYLFLIAAVILVLNLVNSTGEFIMTRLAATRALATGGHQLEFFGQFASGFFSLQNLVVLVLQMFVVSRVFRHIGVRGALFILPLIALGGYATALALPVLGIVKIAKVLENSTDYSIQNTARQALFLPTSREAKYKAKIAIDTLICRMGDVLAALLVLAGSALALGVRQYAAANVVFVLVWLALVVAVAREHRRILPAVA